MARVIFGGGIVGYGGSIGGTTFAKNKSGPYAKAKPWPTNRQTDKQVEVRNAMKTSMDAWNILLSVTEVVRWKQAAEGYKKSKYGQTFSPSGVNLYCAISILCILDGHAVPTKPLDNLGAIPNHVLTFDAAANGECQMNGHSTLAADRHIMIHYTKPVGKNISYRPVPYWIKTFRDNADDDPILMENTYIEGDYAMFIEWRTFDINGALSSLSQDRYAGTYEPPPPGP